MIFTQEMIVITSLICIGLFIFFVSSGYRKGLLYSVFGFCSSLVALFLAYQFASILQSTIAIAPRNYGDYTPLFGEGFIYSIINTVCLTIILFVIFRILFAILLSVFKVVNYIPLVGTLNKILGAFFGILQALICYVVFIFFFSTPIVLNGEEVLDTTKLSVVKQQLLHFDVLSAGIMNDLQHIQYLLNGTHEDAVNEWINSND